MTSIEKLKNYINGEWVNSVSGEFETVVNPLREKR